MPLFFLMDNFVKASDRPLVDQEYDEYEFISFELYVINLSRKRTAKLSLSYIHILEKLLKKVSVLPEIKVITIEAVLFKWSTSALQN